jgi:hypothetical protein
MSSRLRGAAARFAILAASLLAAFLVGLATNSLWAFAVVLAVGLLGGPILAATTKRGLW